MWSKCIVGECGQMHCIHDENVVMEMIVCNECVDEIGLFGLFFERGFL